MFPVLEFSDERGCLTSSEKPGRVPDGIDSPAYGGYSGPEYLRADTSRWPVSLVGFQEVNESSILLLLAEFCSGGP